jgi:hypothetical protein
MLAERGVTAKAGFLTSGSAMRARAGPSVEVSAMIIRACPCGHPREIGKSCAGCGSVKPAKVTDLGVIASGHQDRWRRLKWKLWGSFAANRRIRRVNREMCGE